MTTPRVHLVPGCVFQAVHAKKLQGIPKCHLHSVQIQDGLDLVVNAVQVHLLVPLRLPSKLRPIDGDKISTKKESDQCIPTLPLKGDLPGGANCLDKDQREPCMLSRHLPAGPDLGGRFGDETSSVHALSKTLHDLPPGRFMGHREVVALVVAWDRLLEQNLLEDGAVEGRQVRNMDRRGVLQPD